MCGICGFVGKKDIGLLKGMADTLYHRGPDEYGYYEDDTASLAIRRLSILDLTTGSQPVYNEDRSIVTVFNGEIYNFETLRAELVQKGHSFYTHHSDTENIVHLYEEFGESFVHKLNGMFAIAIWDKKKRALLLYRDRLGVKPLFYALNKSGILFASEIKALLKDSLIKKTIDDEALYHYLSFRNVPRPMTIYKDIRSLLPGEYLVFKNGSVKKQKYWSVQFKTGTVLSEDEYAERIEEILEDAVKLRMKCDVEYGAYLSGGVDSSYIVALMAKNSLKPVKTFSLVYNRDKVRNKLDGHYAKIVSGRYGTEHHELLVNFETLPQILPDIIYHLDEPFAGVIASYLLSGLIKKHVKVALSGDGADDQFGSYGHHRLVFPIEYYYGCLDSKTQLDPQKMKPFQDNIDFVKNIAERHPWEWRLKYAALTEKEKRRLLINEGWKKKFNTEIYLKHLFENANHTDALNRMLETDINTLLPNEILLYADRLSMAHSIELRSPFLDYRMIEFSATIPGALKIKDGILKYILKRSAKKYLPDEILTRPKEGFILPKDQWFLQNKNFITSILNKKRLQSHNYFRPEYVETLIDEFFKGKAYFVHKLWTLIMFQLWFEKNMMGADSDSLCDFGRNAYGC